MIGIKEAQFGNDGNSKRAIISFRIDCAECLEHFKDIDTAIRILIKEDRKVSLILNGEDLSFFINNFNILNSKALEVYYDRYNMFVQANNLNRNESILFLLSTKKGEVEIENLTEFFSKRRKITFPQI